MNDRDDITAMAKLSASHADGVRQWPRQLRIHAKPLFRLLAPLLGLTIMSAGQSQPSAAPQSSSPQASATQATSPQASAPQAAGLQTILKPKVSLGEAARKAKEKKNKPGKVYTDEDLAELHSGSVSVVGGEGSRSSETVNPAGDSKTKDKANSGKNGEAYWRGRARKLQDQIAAVDHEIEKMKQEIKSSGGSGFDAASGLQQNVIYINDRNGRLKQLEDKKAKLQEQMAQLQEEGRKAGADAGWFR